MAASRVLEVGNCTPDHSLIEQLLTASFDVEIDRIMHIDDAISLMKRNRYDLVLVNRLIFANRDEGIDLLRRAKVDPQVKPSPIMMISNYPAAQAACVAEGGVPGFGKDTLDSAATIENLSKYLKKRSAVKV